MRKSENSILYTLLAIYLLILFYFAVFGRESTTNSFVKLELFWGYFHPRVYSFRDNLLNIASFVPIGILVCLIAENKRLWILFFVGLIVSAMVEFSQLIWNRGVFDVDDLINNVLGAILGGLLVVRLMNIRKKATNREL